MPVGPIEEPEPERRNVIEDDALEAWDESGAGPLTGIYAVELIAQAKVIVDLEYRTLYRWRLLQQGQELRFKSQTCRLGLPVVTGVADLDVPIALELVMRSKADELTGPFLSDADPPRLELPELSMLLGATLDDPARDPLPTADQTAKTLDEDMDGELGVTLHASTLVCAERESAYVALRTAGAFVGTVESADVIVGGTDPKLDVSFLGFSDPCLSLAADLKIEVLPDAVFRAVRVGLELDINANGNVTCGEIVAAAPAMFGGPWIE